MHLSCRAKLLVIFHRQKDTFSLNVYTTADNPPLSNIHEHIVRYQLLFYNRDGFVPINVWISVLWTWPISAYLRSIPTTATSQPAFLNYDTSAGMPHPPVGSRSPVLQIKTPLCCRFGSHLPMFWRPTPPPAPPVPEAAAAPLLLPPGLRLPPACGFMDMVIP